MVKKAQIFSESKKIKRLKLTSGRPNYSLWDEIKKEIDEKHRSGMTPEEEADWDAYIETCKERAREVEE